MKSIALWRMKRQAKSSGLRVVGNFLIAFHTPDVISGFALDPAPSSTYIWTFVVPTYDDLSFLHMTLGQRIASAEVDKDFFCGVHKAHANKLEPVRTAADLLVHVDGLDFTSDYSEWIKYISAIRIGDFAAADATLKRLLNSPISDLVQHKLDAVLSSLRDGGESGAQHLLESWSRQTARLVGFGDR